AQDGALQSKAVEFVAVPYYANCNRGPAEMLVRLPEAAARAQPRPAATIAGQARPSASHCWRNDNVAALNDQVEPAASHDTTIPRLTW
ncbi:MAG: hypothetical protein WAU84_07245, partial [Thermoguttaceae bacterium]